MLIDSDITPNREIIADFIAALHLAEDASLHYLA
jgi:hypothetical protein